jgi:hypothetical protein
MSHVDFASHASRLFTPHEGRHWLKVPVVTGTLKNLGGVAAARGRALSSMRSRGSSKALRREAAARFVRNEQ